MTIVHLAFASLHAVLGHAGSSLIYFARFGRSPLAVYRAGKSPHRAWSRVAGGLALAWSITLILSVYSPTWVALPIGRALLRIPALIAWGVALGGLVLMLWSQIAMGAAFRIGQDAQDVPSELRRGGPHAHCRNPIYVGSWLALAGMTAWHPSIALVGLCLALGLAMHALVLAEEAFLSERFGAEYAAYCRKTPRYGLRLP